MEKNVIEKLWGQIWTFLKKLSPAKQIGLVLTSFGVLAGFAMLVIWAGRATYVTLRTNLTPEEASGISRLLREKRVPFLMEDDGKTISVKPESLQELRLDLATNGLPGAAPLGYEVLDKQSFGTTTFIQKINERRAKEGELIRSISSIRGVRRARVHLATPQKSTFVEDQKRSTASVVVDLEPGTVLGEKQIYGIGNLVARAVEGMDMSDVVIVDSNGKQLSRNTTDPLAMVTATQFDFASKVEKDLESSIEEMLARVVGEGRVVARVKAEMDFAQANETQTVYDPEGSVIKSTQKVSSSAEGSRPGPQGPAGAQSNMASGQAQPGQQTAVAAGPAGAKTDTKMNNETVNYSVSQTVRNTSRPTGQIKKLSVAVMVDGKTIKSTDKDGKVLSKVEAWSPEKLKEFEGLVSKTVGLDIKRGDSLDIKSLEFTHEDFEEANRVLAENERRSYIRQIILYVAYGALILLFFLFVVRPFIRWLTQSTVESVDTFLPQTIEELETMQKGQALPGLEEAIAAIPDRVDPEKVEGEMIKDKIVSMVDQNPQKAALILREWLHGNAPTPAGGKPETTKTA